MLKKQVQTTTAAFAPWLGSSSRRSEVLHQLAEELLDCRSADRIARVAVGAMLRETPAENCSLMVLNEESGYLSIAGSKVERPPIRIGEGVAGWVASSRTLVRLDEAAADDRFIRIQSSSVVVRSLISTPITHGGRVLGVMNLSSSLPYAFTDREEQLAMAASKPIGKALAYVKEHEALAAAKEKLEDRVTKFRARVSQVEKMSTVGQLLAGIVHELNNPLTTVLGYSQLLSKAETDGERQRISDRIASESERCARIVQNMLRLSRPGGAACEPVDVNACVRQAAELMDYQLRVNNIGIELSLSAAPPHFEGSSVELMQILLNLITNAEQAIEGAKRPGFVRIVTSTDAGRMKLSVLDNGPGIPERERARIFTQFFTTKANGNGLGLSLVKELVESRNGTIQARTAPEWGAEFTIDFPAIDAPDLCEESNGSSGDSAPRVAAGGAVLAVDDEEHITELIDVVLSDLGHRVDCVNNGEAALEYAAKNEYNLVICDFKMPGMNGRELIHRLLESGKSFRFLLLTGDVVSKEVREFIGSSGLNCLPKPFRIGELAEAVERVLA